jgi:hypothetical protein
LRKEVEQALNGIGAMQAEVSHLLETVELNVDEPFVGMSCRVVDGAHVMHSAS